MCKRHIQLFMICLPSSRCSHEDCPNYATFGLGIPAHCTEHTEDHEYDSMQRNCKSCGLTSILNKEELCTYCDLNHFKTARLAKQYQIEDFLDSNSYFSHGTRIKHGVCLDYIPDFAFDCGTHFAGMEVDENQHNHISKECETVHMKNITQGFGMRTVFKRYNPDEYMAHDSQKHTNSFAVRIKVLQKWLDHVLTIPPPTFLLTCIKLFSDGFDTKLKGKDMATRLDIVDNVVDMDE